ncbi:MAG TPA: hypothetical protein VJ438_01670 [Candidatus Nanoarchaeia archaeon]|nr:hypothetical protein [Candidatus Nanoarchaeia archaeon]
MEKTPLYVNSEGTDDLSIQVVGGIQDFGKQVLNRDFQPTGWPNNLPNLRDFEKNGVIWVDSYKQALWNLYDRNKDATLFTADITDGILVPDRFHSRVYASSIQHLNPEKDTAELITPNKSGIVVSRAGFNPRDGEAYNQAMAYALALHEMGHLALGSKVCNSDNCVFSHNYDALEGIIQRFSSDGKMPICDVDKKRLEEFKERWEIK